MIARLRASGKASLDVGEFKEMFGLTRRLAIPLLEHLDASKVTRRVGDRREILPLVPRERDLGVMGKQGAEARSSVG